jgi:sulfopyruvate decarboxylase TPP-binding subunit
MRASLFLRELEAAGVTDVVGLPDNSSAALFARLQHGGGRIRLHTVTREGEAFALAAGLWMGGARPMVLIQNTGLLESGDSLRGTLMRMRVPIVCVVTYRGYAKMKRVLGGPPAAIDPALLSRHDLDSVALVTEPTLAAWGLACGRLDGEADLPKLGEACARSEEQALPLGLLLTCDMVAGT